MPGGNELPGYFQNSAFMTQPFLFSVAISAWCLGFHSLFVRGMLLHGLGLRLLEWAARPRMEMVSKARKALEGLAGEAYVTALASLERANDTTTWREWLMKPLFSCVGCMSSVHGTLVLVYAYFIRKQPVSLADGLYSIVIAVFLSRITWAAYKRLANA